MTAFVSGRSWMNFAPYYGTDGYEFFDTPEFPEFPQSDSDRIIEIDFKYSGRIDLLAYDYLGDVEYWWVIALLNDLRILPQELSIGKKIRIPTQESIASYLKLSKDI
jgi:hypothetical protein